MRFVSIDVEGTGLDVLHDQVLQVGAVVDDTAWWRPGEDHVSIDDLPCFKANVLHDRIEGQIGGIVMNARILASMKEYNDLKRKSPDRTKLELRVGRFYKHYNVAPAMMDFLIEYMNGIKPEALLKMKYKDSVYDGCSIPDMAQIVINVAGKNFATYDKPMLERLPGWEKKIIVAQRIMDPSMLYWEPFADEKLPNLAECLERSGTDKAVSHDAVDDARDVIGVLRRYYLNDDSKMHDLE